MAATNFGRVQRENDYPPRPSKRLASGTGSLFTNVLGRGTNGDFQQRWLKPGSGTGGLTAADMMDMEQPSGNSNTSSFNAFEALAESDEKEGEMAIEKEQVASQEEATPGSPARIAGPRSSTELTPGHSPNRHRQKKEAEDRGVATEADPFSTEDWGVEKPVSAAQK